ncbi:FtsX-like permease family protein [Nibribacter ruber]|uniref:FtsX-like permease family protein n=1 Tax=Nibribacter ruber TaxID=2698458 RepID=A0A6P1P204_9BACT|nr:ABC transporter permease [Nibribacter ruber]QHL88262.1 FtsX-like permease family protein [Nibribacter ruber]
MLKNYILVAVRTLRRHLGYTMLNVIGLALGITCSLLIFLVVRYELSFDAHHSKADRTYRIAVDKMSQTGPTYTSGTPYPMLATFKTTLPELKPATHVYNEEGGTFAITPSNGKGAIQKFREDKQVLFVEPTFFELFDIETNGVDGKAALKELNTVLLTKTIADKYFPGQNPVGQVLRMNNLLNLKVTGVIPDAPATTDLPYLMLIDYESSKKVNAFMNDSWNSTNSNQQVFFAVPEGASLKQAEDRLNAVVSKFRPQQPGEQERYVFKPLSELHFDERYGNFSGRTVSKTTLWGLSLIGLFLVLVASINFVNLATAQALRRAKEVGMRKVLGASRTQLMTQFLGETGLITLLAIFVSVVLAELLLPYLNKLLEIQIQLYLLKSPDVLLFLAVTLVAVTFFAGFYPALVLSGFKPISALKSKVATARTAGLSLRQVLVVLQFTICQILIICTIIVHNQMEYFRSAELGFDKDAIVTMPLPSGKAKDLMALRAQLEAHPAIKSTSFALAPPSANIDMNMSLRYDDFSVPCNFDVNMKLADEHYLKTFDIPLIAGRMYEKNDTMREFLVNETFLKRVGETNPQNAIGKQLQINGGQTQGRIVGVIKDFHLRSLREEISPVVMSTFSQFYFFVNAKIEAKDSKAALAHLKQVWSSAYPDDVFDYEFLDDAIARFYEEEARQSYLFKVFSVIAILIGCLGLYGLVSFMVTQRTKEVGVRKVLGASSASIVGLFSKDFTKLVLVAFVIAAPVSYYFMEKWLQDFTYRIDISYWVFLAAGALTLLIALATVSVQALRAALANPVRALKTE